MHFRILLSLIGFGALISSCGGPLIGEVADATYTAIVPTAEQIANDAGQDLPGGFIDLHNSGIESVELVLVGDEVTVRLQDGTTVTRSVTDRLIIQDKEGSGPFKAEKEVLVLGSDPLTLGLLEITDPVIWPGSFDGSPVITLKTFDPGDQGPGVSCALNEACLLLTSGVYPIGRYEDANNPALNENPIATIEVLEMVVKFTLDSGEVVEMSRDAETITTACGLSETAAWDVPTAVGLRIEDPVLLHASCPSTTGDTYLAIIERDDIPVLAPLGPEFGGEWCPPGPDCLLFVPTG